MASSKLQAFLNHPAGPKTVHFWAPAFKWGISIANIADFSKPPEKISYPQQIDSLQGADMCKQFLAYILVYDIYALLIPFVFNTAVMATGLIWSRYSTQITPKNWNLVSVNLAMAGTSVYQLSRKLRQDYFSEEVVAKD